MIVGDVYIDALGTWLPELFSAERAVRDGLYDAVDHQQNELTGVRVADPGTAPADMAVRAVHQVAERRGGGLGPIDLLLHASSSWQGPEGWMPASYIQRRTYGGTGPAWELHLGCLGGLVGFEVAVGFLRAEPGRRAVLFTSADNWSSPVVDRWRSFPGVLLGDGASALTLTKAPGFARLLAVNTGGVPDLEGMYRGAEPLYPGDSPVRPPMDFRTRATAYKEADPASTDAMVRAARVQRELIDRSLAQAGITLGDVTRLAYVHYARFLTEQWLVAPLGLALSTTTWEVSRDVGHIGPSDQLVALDRLLASGELDVGDHLLMAGLGPGMTIGSAVLEIVDRPRWLA